MSHRGTQTFNKIAMVIGTIASLGSAAHAVPVFPGGSVLTPGTTVAARPELAGVVLYDNVLNYSLTSPSGAVLGTGTFQDRVVKENGAGTLDFYYRITADSTSTASITAVKRFDFGPVTTDVDWRIDGLGSVGSEKASRSTTANVIQFYYSPSNDWITPGNMSRFTFIKTNATNFVVKGATQLIGVEPTGLPATATFITTEPDPASAAGTYHFYTLQPTDLNVDKVDGLARTEGLALDKTGATVVTFSDSNHKTRLVGDLSNGLLDLYTNYAKLNTGKLPSTESAGAQALSFLRANLLLPAVRGTLQEGQILTTSNGIMTGDTNLPAVQHDVLRTVPFSEIVDNIPVVGPLSQLSVDVGPKGAVGLHRTLRPIAVADSPRCNGKTSPARIGSTISFCKAS